MATTPEGRIKKQVKKLLDARRPELWYYMPVQNGMGTRVLDFIGCSRGRFFSIETKRPGGKLTPYQLGTKEQMEAAHGTVFAVDGDPTALERLAQWLDKPPMHTDTLAHDRSAQTRPAQPRAGVHAIGTKALDPRRLLDVREIHASAPEQPSGLSPVLLAPEAQAAEPFFVPGRNLILLPDMDPWRQLADGHAPRSEYLGQPVFVLRNSPELHQLLKNMGLRVPAPILHDHYDWSGQTPYRAQIETAALLSASQRAYCLNDLGTGKTLAALMAVDWLILRGHAMKALVIAPLSTLDHVWRKEIWDRCPRLYPIILHGSKAERIKRLADPTGNVFVINTDGIKVIPDELREAGFDIIIVDELASFRDHSTDRWKTLRDLLKGVPYVWGMTGAPTPNGPWDAYAQARLLTPETVPLSFKRFRELVAVEVRQGIWRPKPEGKEIVYRVLQPAVRFKRSEVVELPPCQHLHRRVDLSEEQTDTINQLRRHFVAEFKEGRVEAKNAAVMMGKLLQAACGAIYTSDGETVELDPAPRVEAALEVIHEAEGKVILFAYYRHIVELLYRELSKPGVMPKNSVAMVHGQTEPAERSRLFRRFQDPDNPLRVLVAQPTTMAHGLTLTQASVIVWFHPILSLETYQQANARITRPGQVREQVIMHLWGTSMEQRLYEALQTKGSVQQAILRLFEHDLA